MQRGTRHTEKARAKMSATRKGRIISPDHRAAVSLALTGRQQSPEHRQKRLAAVAAAKAAQKSEQPAALRLTEH